MPYDPNWPQDGDLADPNRFREQFGGLKNFIDAGVLSGVVIDNVTTLPPGEVATVSASIIAGVLHLSFGIPQGPAGTAGANGSDGSQGPQGPMGAVTPQNLDDAISGTSPNTNSVATLDAAFTNDPLSLAEGELLRAKLNELIVNGRR